MAGAFAAGYLIVLKGYPYLHAKIQAMNLDDAWDIFDEEWTSE